MVSERYHQHDVVSSPSLTEETITTKRQKLIGTLTSPSLPTLPFDLIPEILWRLPVNLLVQFRCVCKSWNTLISDHLLVHTLTYSRGKSVLKSYPLDYVFANFTANPIEQLEFPFNHVVYFVGSCNGILCLLSHDYASGFVIVRLWNPSIRKFKELPDLQKPHTHDPQMYGFGHDPVTDNYKVVVVDNHQGKVHTLGTNSWKSIQKLPFGYSARQRSGKFMRDTINWLVSARKNQRFIVSLDLKNESYKEISLPDDYGKVNAYIYLHLGVLRDCLCMVCGRDVWVMKEHGNKDSWTKLFTISYMPDFEVLHIFEDGKVLLKSLEGWKWKLIFYNSRNDTFKFTHFENIYGVCVESLISPYS